VTDFKKLQVWRKAHEMTLDTYRVTAAFPREEMYGLTSQLRRSCASIGANIAEGCGRRSDGEMCRFLQIARGSASETEYHFLLARDMHFLTEKDFPDIDPEGGRIAAHVNRVDAERSVPQKRIVGTRGS
jgi:four helix bundle protein